MFEGKAQAARNRQDLVMQAAWTAAALGRIKKMPRLKDMLSAQPKRSKPVSWQAMYASAASWAAAFGEIRTEGDAA
ncbi:MAG: hypothetical protein B7X90_01765 [Novosphingobium sp. 17-62-19]|nr:MAG: hypothetical protein B7X90_01765 [Novosphingobium sp. 17-62-19]